MLRAFAAVATLSAPRLTWDLASPLALGAALGPDLLLTTGAIVLLIASAWRPDGERHQRRIGAASLVLIVATMLMVLAYAIYRPVATTGPIAVDEFRWAVDLVVLLGALCTIALSIEANASDGIDIGESHVLVLFATAGMLLLAAARDLMLVFLGIELMSVAAYILAGLNRRSEKSAEGALKYFLLGAFSTGFLLYGIALVYGATGTTNLTVIGDRIARYSLQYNSMLVAGMALLLVGFGFKVAAAPFHMWAPDVYEGAPTPITAFMAASVKAAAFAAFVRIWLDAFPGVVYQWHNALWLMAVLTMLVGNVVALRQRNLKRMLAYSSIAQAGYVLVAVVAATMLGAAAFLFYVLSYTLATMGAFGTLAALRALGEPHAEIDDLAGLSSTRPWLTGALAVCLLALLGFPIFGGMGFVAKYYMLHASLQAAYLGRPFPQVELAVALVVTSVISAGYYLRVVTVMLMQPRPATAPARSGRRVGWLTGTVIGASVGLLLVFGVVPALFVNWAAASAPIVQGHAAPYAGASRR